MLRLRVREYGEEVFSVVVRAFGVRADAVHEAAAPVATPVVRDDHQPCMSSLQVTWISIKEGRVPQQQQRWLDAHGSSTAREPIHIGLKCSTARAGKPLRRHLGTSPHGRAKFQAPHRPKAATTSAVRTLAVEVLCYGLEVGRMPSGTMHDDDERLGLDARVNHEIAHVQLHAVRALQSARVCASLVLRARTTCPIHMQVLVRFAGDFGVRMRCPIATRYHVHLAHQYGSVGVSIVDFIGLGPLGHLRRLQGFVGSLAPSCL